MAMESVRSFKNSLSLCLVLVPLKELAEGILLAVEGNMGRNYGKTWTFAAGAGINKAVVYSNITVRFAAMKPSPHRLPQDHT